MNFQLVLFDLGSTLVYFQGNWDRVVHQAIHLMSEAIGQLGYSLDQAILEKEYAAALQTYYIERDIDNIEKTTITLLNKVITEKFHLDLSPKELIHALDIFYDYTGSHWKLDKEAIPTLQKLQEQGYHLGLISNASYSRDVLNQLNTNRLIPYFEQILVSADVGYRKPHSVIFQKALDYFHVQASETVMIGDTLNADIIGSRRMGMKNIWIARWASAPTTHYQDDIIVPDRTIQRLSQIPALLKNW